eukprot:scaffold52116_cov40-Attheya_sp.AAC.1
MKHDPKQAWKSIRLIQKGISSHHEEPRIMKMKMPNGETATNDKENADVFEPHFEKVFNNVQPTDETVLEEIEQRTVDETLDFPPTRGEVVRALKKMQNGKAPGENGNPPDAYKALQGEALDTLITFLTKHWVEDEVDYESWHRNMLCCLPKGGDISDPNRWRGVCLSDIACKIQSSIISARLLEHLSEVGIENQFGCIPKKGCIDALFCIRNALHIRKQHDLDTWAIFIDLVKAFDTADHKMLLKILERYGVPQQMLKVIKKLYTDTIVVLKIGKEKREIKYEVG